MVAIVGSSTLVGCVVALEPLGHLRHDKDER